MAEQKWAIVNLERYGSRYLAFHEGHIEDGATIHHTDDNANITVKLSFDELVKLAIALRSHPLIEEASRPKPAEPSE